MAILERKPPRSTLSEIPAGAAGVRATLDIMVALTKQYRTDPAMRQVAEQILRRAGLVNGTRKDYYRQAQALSDWVRDNITYLQDTVDVETIKTPDVLLREPFGDCDDKSLLLATLLNSIGHPARFVAVGYGGGPGYFEHVYVETKIGNTWIGAETTEPQPFGWKPPRPGADGAFMARDI